MPTPRGRCHCPDQSGYLVSSKACAAPALMLIAIPNATARAIPLTVLGSSIAPSLGDDRAAALRAHASLRYRFYPVTAQPGCAPADHDRFSVPTAKPCLGLAAFSVLRLHEYYHGLRGASRAAADGSDQKASQC